MGSELTPASDSSDQTYPDVAYDEAGGGYAVVWQHSSDVHGTILDHAGAVMGEEETLSEASNAQERQPVGQGRQR